MPRLAVKTVPTWQDHVVGWGACKRCILHTVRANVVLARGKLPCDILFVGEAPGRSEDVAGKPFVEGAQAGSLLEEIITEAFDGDREKYRVAVTNLLGCIPLSDAFPECPTGDLLHPRDVPECVAPCSPRLQELVRLAQPKLLVRVGKDATDHLTPGYRHSIEIGWQCKVMDMVHPAAIRRMKPGFATIERQRAIVQLRTALQNGLQSGRPVPVTPPAPPKRWDDDIPF